MGDHRVSIEVTLTGRDGKERHITQWLNWSEDLPSRLFDDLVKLAEDSQLPVNPFYSESNIPH